MAKKQYSPSSIWQHLKPTDFPITLVGLDPGVNNFGWGAVKITGVDEQGIEIYEGLECGLFQASEPVKDKLADKAHDVIRDLVAEISQVIGRYQPYTIAMERFSLRREGWHGDIEYINLMIGAILIASNRPVDLFLSQTWKPKILGSGDGKTLASKSKEMFPMCNKIVHAADASCIALYGFRRLVKWGFINGVSLTK